MKELHQLPQIVLFSCKEERQMKEFLPHSTGWRNCCRSGASCIHLVKPTNPRPSRGKHLVQVANPPEENMSTTNLMFTWLLQLPQHVLRRKNWLEITSQLIIMFIFYKYELTFHLFGSNIRPRNFTVHLKVFTVWSYFDTDNISWGSTALYWLAWPNVYTGCVFTHGYVHIVPNTQGPQSLSKG